MSRGFAVGDHDDLLGGARMVAQKPPGQVEGVLHVRPVHPLPAGSGQVLRLDPAGEVREADQVELVVRIPALDQRVQGQCHLLRRDEVPAERHRERQVEQQRGGCLGPGLRLDQLEVRHGELRPSGRPPSDHRVEHRLLHGDLAAVPELPRPGRAGRLGNAPGLARVVRPFAIPPELLEQLHQDALAKPARALRSDLEPAAAAGDQPGFFQSPFDLLQTPEVPHGVIAHGVAEPILVDVLEGRAGVVGPHRAVQVLEIRQPFEGVDRGLHRHGFLAAGQGGVVPGHVREELRQGAGQSVDLEGQVHVLKNLPGQLIQLGALLGRQ